MVETDEGTGGYIMKQDASTLWHGTIPVLACMAMLICAARAVAEAPPKPPELKVLDKLIGDWDFKMVSKVAEWTPNEVQVTGTLTREWILDGRFVQEKGKQSDGVEALVTFTYDAGRKAYRSWHFSSTGLISQSQGKWDEASESLLFQSDMDNGMTATSTLHIIDNDTHEWTAIVKDKAGKVFFDGGGKCTRRK